MKVAVYTRLPRDMSRPRGGIESVAVVLVQTLARQPDLDVHVVTLERDQATLETEQHTEFTVHRLPASRWPQSLDVLIGPGRRRLRDYVCALQPDLMHSHETYGLALNDLPLPHVFTVHGFDHANLVADSARLAWLRSPVWRYVERHGLARQQDIISISPYVRGMIEPQTKARIYDIDNPCDERFFNVNYTPQPGRVLCVGWINHRKNTLGSLLALAHARRQGVEARLAIAGEPHEQAYHDAVRAAVREHKLEQHVDFLGHIKHDQLLEELGRASVFLLPSRQENAPMAISEAMAVGVPVIASNRCGMPFMVSEGCSGYLIDPEDTAQIGDRLTAILGEPDWAAEMSRRSREIAFQRFHPDAVARKTIAAYEQVIQQQGGAQVASEGPRA